KLFDGQVDRKGGGRVERVGVRGVFDEREEGVQCLDPPLEGPFHTRPPGSFRYARPRAFTPRSPLGGDHASAYAARGAGRRVRAVAVGALHHGSHGLFAEPLPAAGGGPNLTAWGT